MPITKPEPNCTTEVYHASAESPLSQWLGDAALFCCAAATLLLLSYLVAPLFHAPLLGLVIADVGALLIVPLVGLRLRRAPLGSLGLVGWPRTRDVVGSLLVGSTFWYVNLDLSNAWVRVTGTAESVLGFGTRWVAPYSVVVSLLAIALVPALAEEVACRGLLLRVNPRTTGWRIAAVMISAIFFAAMHLSLGRAASMFALGLVLGTARVKTGLLLPGIFIHVVNNAVAILLFTGIAPTLQSAIEGHPALTLAACAISSTVGLALLFTGSRPTRHPSQ